MTDTGITDSDYNATVITHYGNEVLFQTQEGERLRGVPRQSLPALATGDRIRYAAQEGGLAVISDVAPRHGILTRQTKNQEKIVAVNIDQVLIVSAMKPALSTGLIDRYLIACELAGLSAVLLFNKTDIASDEQLQSTRAALAVYEQIGYSIYYLSAKTGAGLAELQALLANKTSVLVGHSAVGKSSLIKALLPDSNPRIGEVSQSSQKGRHTTTHTEIYGLPQQGLIIDSPGVREFGLVPVAPQQLARGFREFLAYDGQCRFRDCTHTSEPGCAISEAEKSLQLDSRRVQSYRHLLAELKNS